MCSQLLPKASCLNPSVLTMYEDNFSLPSNSTDEIKCVMEMREAAHAETRRNLAAQVKAAPHTVPNQYYSKKK